MYLSIFISKTKNRTVDFHISLRANMVSMKPGELCFLGEQSFLSNCYPSNIKCWWVNCWGDSCTLCVRSKHQSNEKLSQCNFHLWSIFKIEEKWSTACSFKDWFSDASFDLWCLNLDNISDLSNRSNRTRWIGQLSVFFIISVFLVYLWFK